jgi:hypothetical protein
MILTGNTGVTEISIPKTVATMRGLTGGYHGAFYNSAVTKVVFEEGITAIPAHAMEGATKLTEVVIPNSVSTIGTYAFAETGFTGFTIPDHITSIGDQVFYNATKLTNVTWTASVTVIPEDAFSGCTALETIVLPETLLTIKSEAFETATVWSHLISPIAYIPSLRVLLESAT